MGKTSIFIIVMLFINVIVCTGEVVDKGVKITEMDINRQETNRYKILIPGANYIKIKAKDVVTGEIINLIVENSDFAYFLASQTGLITDKQGRFNDNQAFMNYRENEYADYMVRNEGKVIEINLSNYEKFIGKTRYGMESSGKRIIKNSIFDQPMTLDQLGVKNENELIEKYFEFNKDTGEGKIKLEYEYKNEISKNPSFIAKLIELGYIVGRGDIVPVLFIKKIK